MIKPRRLAAGILAMLFVALAAPATAPAARGLTVGFLDDANFFASGEGGIWLDRAHASNARILRVNLLWSQVAP